MGRLLRLCAVLLAAVSMAASAQAPARLEVIVFAGGFNWPIWAAEERGYFRNEGVEVHVTPTPGSVFQLVNLIDGKFDIAMTAIDNLIAYREGEGEDPKVGPDLVAVMGADQGFLKLVSVPEVTSIAQLRGKTVSVDARSPGYAFVLFELLDRAGLREPDYKVERAGGVLQRFQALMEKKHDATLLLSPFEVQADGPYFNVLDFFGRLSRLSRIINVGDLEFADPEKARGGHYSLRPGSTVSGIFTATTYFTKPGDVSPATGAAKAGAKP